MIGEEPFKKPYFRKKCPSSHGFMDVGGGDARDFHLEFELEPDVHLQAWESAK